MTIPTATGLEAAPDRDTRPNPVLMAEAVRNLVELHDNLTAEIAHAAARGAREKVTKSDGVEHPAPGNWTAVAVRADIYHIAHGYAKMLLADRPQTTARLDGELLPALTELIATHVGYFTGHRLPNIAWAFHDDVKDATERACAILEPTDDHRTPIGPCAEPDCKGIYRIVWQTSDGDDDTRAWRMSNSHRVATCTKNHEHRIDAMLYAAGDYERA